MSRIRILTEQVANRIAAGEVVERPASVVKELVENAIDAGARSIRVEAESGGKRMIRVADDGCGMSPDDALLAFERHATSKLRTADDLLSIATLGFRGEALPSIAAVSRLLLETCERASAAPSRLAGSASGDPHLRGGADTPGRVEEQRDGMAAAVPGEGTRVEFAGGKLVSVKPAGLPPGTTISVADLFYCVPARRKFLKSETTELGHIASVVTHYALAHPDKQFILKTPSQEIIATSPVGTLGERVYQLLGREALAEMVELEPVAAPFRAAITEPALEAGEESATLTARGFVSRPEVQRANRNGTYVFVNGRLVRDRLILHAVNEAYRNIIPPGVFPIVLLFLEMPPEEVDVNVHPAKVEVRFRHPNFVHDFTRDSVRLALAKARPVAAFPAKVAPAPGGSRPGEGAAHSPDATASAGSASAAPGAAAAAAPARAVIPAYVPPSSDVPLHDGFALAPDVLPPAPQRFAFEAGAPIPADRTGPAEAGLPADLQADGGELNPAAMKAATWPPAPANSIATLKPLGQINSSFIVAINGEGLWIVDQHVAHERVLFEQHLRARQNGDVGGQRLLMPIVVELSPRQFVLFEQIAEELRANGFEAAPIGPRSVAVQAAPAGIAAGDAEKLLRQILEGIERENQAISMDSLQAKIAASTACHAAIKVNMPLDQTTMEWLLAELAKTDAPMACPHGRPVVLRYSVREIEKAFKRI